MKPKILIATASFGELEPSMLHDLNQSFDCVANTKGRKLKPKELKQLISSVDGVIAGTEIYSPEVLADAKNLKVISRVGVGIDNVDLDFCSKHHIEVIATKTDLSFSVAELVISLSLSFLRNIPHHFRDMQNQNWERIMGETINGKTIGIVGLGKIGKRLVELASGFNLTVLACDPYQDMEFSKKYSVKYCTMEELLEYSDIISIHASSEKINHPIISKDELQLMKSTALLINTSRGANIDENALLYALQKKTIGGACLDVFSQEPYEGDFANLDNVILTPHIGGYTSNVRKGLEMESVVNLRKFL
jgi:D-3-phosphoglycerate dehydrogenase|tara:strand:- start:218 stop:1135 length:918 start_codon:yes stop_codon:yes gene_type:complete